MWRLLTSCTIACTLVVGCVANQRQTRKPPYDGPTEPMRDVVSAINANNERIPTLYASHDYTANVVDEKGKTHPVQGDGTLVYRAPFEMRLIGKSGIAG